MSSSFDFKFDLKTAMNWLTEKATESAKELASGLLGSFSDLIDFLKAIGVKGSGVEELSKKASDIHASTNSSIAAVAEAARAAAGEKKTAINGGEHVATAETPATTPASPKKNDSPTLA